MNANIYLFLAYTLIFAAIFGFMWYLDRKTRTLREDVTLLQERIAAELEKKGSA